MKTVVLLLLVSLASLSSAYQGRRSLAVKAVASRCRQPWTCTKRVNSSVTAAQRASFVGAHNFYRTQAALAGNPIANLTWNNDLAAYAQDWINFLRGSACNDTLENLMNGKVGNITTGVAGSLETIYYRDGKLVDVGENLFYAQLSQYARASRSTFFRSDWPKRLTDFWVNSQSPFYNFTSKNCTGNCADFLQVVLNETKLFGCGFGDCKIAFNQGGYAKANVTLRIVSCNYFPTGIYEGINPY